MTVRVDIAALADLEALIAWIEEGEDILLTRDGQVVATINIAKQEVEEPVERVPGLFAHLGPMEDPDLFFRPDPEFIELAESHDERDFYQPLPPEKK